MTRVVYGVETRARRFRVGRDGSLVPKKWGPWKLLPNTLRERKGPALIDRRIATTPMDRAMAVGVYGVEREARIVRFRREEPR